MRFYKIVPRAFLHPPTHYLHDADTEIIIVQEQPKGKEEVHAVKQCVLPLSSTYMQYMQYINKCNNKCMHYCDVGSVITQ